MRKLSSLIIKCRRFAVTKTEWLTGNSGSDQCSKFSAEMQQQRTGSSRSSLFCIDLFFCRCFFFPSPLRFVPSKKDKRRCTCRAGRSVFIFFSSYNAVPISLMALLISLTAFNREHYLCQKLFQWKIKADNRVIFKATVRQDGVWQLQWIWHLQISQDLTDEANAVLIFGDS